MHARYASIHTWNSTHITISHLTYGSLLKLKLRGLGGRYRLWFGWHISPSDIGTQSFPLDVRSMFLDICKSRVKGVGMGDLLSFPSVFIFFFHRIWHMMG